MIGKKIFISSTYFNLKDLRAEIAKALKEWGYTPIWNESPDFPTKPGLHSHDICLDVVKECDIYLLIIDKRYGGTYAGNKYPKEDISITWYETKIALQEHKEIHIFVRDEVWNERPTYKKNLEEGIIITPHHVDTPKVFEFIDFIIHQPRDNWINTFKNSVELKEKLKVILKVRDSQVWDAAVSIYPNLNNELHFMRLAIEEAKKSINKLGKTPIYVGAVVTKNGEILATAYRGESETGVHAEVTALEKSEDKHLEGATLYTTLEPCIVGSHPGEKYRWPCARWIVEKRIKKVWIGDLDPNPNICGRGVEFLEDNRITVDYFPSDLREKLKELNKEFIEKQKRRPTVQLANRNDEKSMIWRFLSRLQFQEERYYGSRLLWFCGPSGIGKSELIAWLRVVAEERKIIKAHPPLTLSGNPAIIYFRQLANVKSDEIEAVRREGASPEDFVCTDLAIKLSADTQPKILILDSDFNFDDLEGLSNLVGRLLSKLQHAPYVSIMVATRKPPSNINAHTVLPLNLSDVEEMCKMNNWQIERDILEELYEKSNGNPLLVILLHACYVTSGKLPGSTNIRDILQDFLSHLNPMGQKLLKKLAVALSAPFEEGEKMIDKNTLLATIPTEERALCEKALKELSEMSIVHIKNSHLWMHDEITEQIEKLLPEHEAIQQHYDLAQILKDKDPLGALWHLMKSKKEQEVIEILDLAYEFCEKQLQGWRFINTFIAVFNYFSEEPTRLKNKEDIKIKLFFYMGNISKEIAKESNTPEKYCKKAIETYEEVLEFWTLERFPMQYATTQNNIGNAYSVLARVRDKAENSKKAIEAHREALKVYTFERFPIEYASTQNGLGIAYEMLAQVEVENWAESCERAIEAHREALKVYTFERFPIEYALTWRDIGSVYYTLGEGKDKAKNCKKAIEAYEEALKVINLENFPIRYGAIQNNIGNAYAGLAEVKIEKNRAENCKKAIKAYKEALKVRTLERLPVRYAMTQHNLGTGYKALFEIEGKVENCKKAIEAFGEALRIYTLEDFPVPYATTQNGLGTAYSGLAQMYSRFAVKEGIAENCEKAIEAYKKSLKVFTLEHFPIDYAMAQFNLGNTYIMLAEIKDEAENCEKAIEAYREALKVFTEETFPEFYQTVERTLRKLLGLY